MLKSELFLGFPVKEDFSHLLKELKKEQLALFIGESDNAYLEQIEIAGRKFIGKKVGEEAHLESLIGVESHIYSILNKIFPDYPSKNTPLILLTLHE